MKTLSSFRCVCVCLYINTRERNLLSTVNISEQRHIVIKLDYYIRPRMRDLLTSLTTVRKKKKKAIDVSKVIHYSGLD